MCAAGSRTSSPAPKPAPTSSASSGCGPRRARFGKGGPFLFGSFGAADIIYAPVVSRFISYGVPVPGFAMAYMQAVWEHEWMKAWVAASEAEEWTIEKFETPQMA